MKTKYIEMLAEYYRLEKEENNIYKNYAVKKGISESRFQILYSVYVESAADITQTDICEMWDVPLQTINTSLKQMAQEGIIELVGDENNRRRKHVKLTITGEKLAEKLVAPIIKAENDAFVALSETEQIQLLNLTKKQLHLLKEYIDKTK